MNGYVFPTIGLGELRKIPGKDGDFVIHNGYPTAKRVGGAWRSYRALRY